MTYDYERLARGDEIVLDADWDDDEGEGELRETEFITVDKEAEEVVVRWRGDRYRFDVDLPYYVYVHDMCWECHQDVWRTVGEDVTVDLPSYVEKDQLTLDEIRD